MGIGERDLRNETSRVIDPTQASERATASAHGELAADIATNKRRSRWLSGPELRRQLADSAADPALRRDLDELAGQTLDTDSLRTQ